MQAFEGFSEKDKEQFMKYFMKLSTNIKGAQE